MRLQVTLLQRTALLQNTPVLSRVKRSSRATTPHKKGYESPRVSIQAAVRGLRHTRCPKVEPAKAPPMRRLTPRKLGGDLWVVKAQVHAGGRGKAGGVKLSRNLLDEVRAVRRGHAGNAAGHAPIGSRRASGQRGLRRGGFPISIASCTSACWLTAKSATGGVHCVGGRRHGHRKGG